MDIHLKNYLKNFIPIGVYCHSSILGDWCPFYKSTWGKTINNYKRNRNECEWKNVCEDNCEECDETVSYCQFCNIIEYGDFPLGDGCKICNECECGILENEDKIIKNNKQLNFYKNVLPKILEVAK